MIKSLEPSFNATSPVSAKTQIDTARTNHDGKNQTPYSPDLQERQSQIDANRKALADIQQHFKSEKYKKLTKALQQHNEQQTKQDLGDPLYRPYQRAELKSSAQTMGFQHAGQLLNIII